MSADWRCVPLILSLLAATLSDSQADEPTAETPAERGYRILRTTPFLPPDFDQRTFDVLWTVWPEPLP